MQLVFLGTSCAKPTKNRSHSAIFLSHSSDGILFDCGEGTQRQMTLAGIKPTKVNKIFISHWHGDHILGLGGLIQTLGISEYDKTLKIYGPKGSKKFYDHLTKSMQFEQRIEVEIHELENDQTVNFPKFKIKAYSLKHGPETLGYRFIEKDKRRIRLDKIKKLGIPEGPLLGELQEGKEISFKNKKIKSEDVTSIVKGRIIAYLPDSIVGKNTLSIAENANIMISDSTFSEKLREKADEHEHLTARQAAEIANQANVKQLILTHFSTRYKNTSELKEEAEEIFPNVLCAEDFMKINL